MRLRRETGDFSIKFAENAMTKTVVSGLGAEDLIGAIIEYGGDFYVVTSTSTSEGVIILASALEGYTVTYTVGTGELRMAAAGANS